MQGALLRSGKNDEFIALGETGQPVYKAALQIIAALTRKSPDLTLFLAIPKSNERGEVIDWYSPVPGDVIPWASADENEREYASNRLSDFIQSIRNMSRRLVENGEKTHQGDLQIFGKLLGLVSHCPDEGCLYLIQRTSRDEARQQKIELQPVLSFWGFVTNDTDRHLDPLFFLAPRPAMGTLAPNESSLGETASTPLQVHTVSSLPASPSSALPRPWWRRFWWLWPLLLLLTLLLLLSLLRGCAPNAALPWNVSVPRDMAIPTTGTAAGIPAAHSARSSVSAPESPVTSPSTEAPSGEAPIQQPNIDLAEPPVEPALEQPAESTPVDTPEQSAPEESVETNSATAAPVPPELSIPPEAQEGPADFLNGNYRAGAGIIDATTAKPLRLEYAFEKGKGSVTIQRPDGTACTGAVSAAMQGGQLGINSDDQATCSDGGRYDMPKVNCAPGAQSIADCTGSYGQTQFPMIMRRQ